MTNELDLIILWLALILSGVALVFGVWGVIIRRLYVRSVADLSLAILANALLLMLMCFIVWRIRVA